ncbi:MAG: hypothetical protein GY940_47190, partial [bacterium]|nr:hypothetical protein [bacterium]
MKPKAFVILTLLAVVFSTGASLSAAVQEKGQAKKPGVFFVTPKKDRMWVGRLQVTLRLKNIRPVDVRMVEVYLDGRLIKELERRSFTFSHSFGRKGHNRTLKALVRGADMKVLARCQVSSYHSDDSQNVEVRQVMVPVVVKDKNGNYIRGLKKDDFEVFSDDEPVKVSYLEVGG